MSKEILLVVDYQNDFVNGSLGFEGAEDLDKKISQRIREYGQGRVIYAADTHYENYLQTREGKSLPIEHCIKGSEGWQVFGETKKALEEVNAEKFEKESFAIDPKKLDKFRGLKSLELAGLVTNMCLISNVCVFQSISPETQMIVDKNLCDSFDSDLHHKALDVLEGLQVKII